MKSNFGRTFFPAVISVVSALLALGLLLQMLIQDDIEKKASETLKKDAIIVSKLAEAYNKAGVNEPHHFFLNIELLASTTDTDIVICDPEGFLRLCSDAPMGCEHQGLMVNPILMERVNREGIFVEKGIVGGLYQENRYMVCSSMIYADRTMPGMVIVSAPVERFAAQGDSFNALYIYGSLLVFALCVTVLSLFARHSSRPLNELNRAAVAFGHGNLDTRVEIDPAAPKDVQELALSFNNMADSLQKSEYRRQEFVANVSHELKTPMTTIAGFADGILDGTIPAQKQEYYLQLISQETKRLNRLVRSMLDVSKLHEQEGIPDEQKTQFEITDCVGRVLLTFEQKILSKKLDVQVDFPDYPLYTSAQEDQIVQVIYNLLDNAVKFCPEEGVLGLQITEQGSKIYVSISNTGPTIPPAELPLVFDRFHKIDKSRTERDGWGLGLYIVKTIVCAHGEDLSVTSKDDKTEFTFTLPLIH